MHKNALIEQSPKDSTVIPRMLNEIQARAYTGLGRSSIRKLGEEIGCIHRYGRRILYDRQAIDAFFDKN